MRIDAHQHFWRPSRGDYRWLLAPEVAAIRRDFGPADLAPRLAEAGIGRTVLVQATDTDAETDFLLELAAGTPFVAGVVGWVDLESPHAPERIAALARNPRLVGVRPMIQDLPDPAWMLSPRLERGLDALVEHDIAFDALVRPVHLPHLCALLARRPLLRVVIDHGAKPAGAVPSRAWREDLAAIARASSVVCKLSGLATEARPGWTPVDLAPCVDALLEAFGPSRLLWGSDWPVVELAGGFRAWWDATLALLAGLDDSDRDAVLGGNAARSYRLAERAVA